MVVDITSIWQLIYPLALTDMAVAFPVGIAGSYFMYKYFQWKSEKLLKKMHPDEKNGLNFDISYKLAGSEVFGIHMRGLDFQDMLDNATRAFKEWTTKKDEVINTK